MYIKAEQNSLLQLPFKVILLHGTEQLIESGDLELLVEASGGLRLRTQRMF